MMNDELLTGRLVRLGAEEPKAFAQYSYTYSRDGEFRRYLDSGIPRLYSLKQAEKWAEKELLEETKPDYFLFAIYALEDDRLIGGLDLEVVAWGQGEAFVGIGLDNRQEWGKGYGSDAMGVALRFAFDELNLRRVSLDVFAYNPRAIRSYEKMGFVHEGRIRRYLKREGERWDILYMGILRDEWIKRNR
ncbi:MAG: GNAT family N-acetyltransferase [Anaerolineales bacterium]|nr:GNAT family N-acetyltransferase [Anaerolineales bacterium]